MAEITMRLPKECVPKTLTIMIWASGIYPWSYAMHCGPDFLSPVTMDQKVGWAATEALARLDYDNALLDAIERGAALLSSQGYQVESGDPLDVIDDDITTGLQILTERLGEGHAQ